MGKKVALMEISPEEIRNGRERLQMTQQQLAEELGVSKRSIGSWERGETIPRNRLAALAEALGLEGTSEFGEKALLRQVGRLAKQRREELGLGRVPFSKEIGLGSDRTLVSFEFGRTLPSGTSQRKIERGLGWRLGVIDDVMRMTNRKASEIAMEELDAEDAISMAENRPLSEVPSDELLNEIRRRLIDRPQPKLLGDAMDLFGLAAHDSDERAEDEEKGTDE